MGWVFFFGIWLWCFFFDLIVLIPFSGMSAVFLYGLWFSRWTWPKGAKKGSSSKRLTFFVCKFLTFKSYLQRSIQKIIFILKRHPISKISHILKIYTSYICDKGFLHQLVFGLKLIAVKLIHDETLVDLLQFVSCQTRHSPKNLFS